MHSTDKTDNAQLEEKIRTILAPLQKENSSAEYMYHFTSMIEFDRGIRATETHYANLYSQLIAVETQIAHQKNFS